MRRAAMCVALAGAMLTVMVGNAAAASSSAADTSCTKPSGAPIPLSMIANFSGPGAGDTNFRGGAQAAVKRVNCDGGVQGRPLQLITCNGNPFVDPNLGPNCAREAVSKEVVASVGMTTLDSSVVEAFDDAGIPIVGAPVSLRGLTAPHSFPIVGGLPGALAGQAAKLYDEGSRRIRVLSVDVPGSAALAIFANLGLTPRGSKALETVLLPHDPALDDSAVIQSAITGADAIILAMTGDQLEKVVPEIRSAGFKGKLSSQVTIVSPDQPQVKDFLFAAFTYPASSTGKPGIDRYNADMDRFSPNDRFRGLEGDIVAWESVQIVADALQTAPTISAAALYTALQTYTVSFGVAPDIDFSTGGGVYGIPRIFTPYVIAQKVKNKEYVADGDFFNPTQPPATTSKPSKK